MTLIAVTQRVSDTDKHNERRDALDQRWIVFLQECGLIPLLIPNHLDTAKKLVQRIPIEGVLLTGGNDLPSVGGMVPERDEVEMFLLQWAVDRDIPLTGVCRGMQMIQNFFGIDVESVEGHIQPEQIIMVDGVPESLNSYHNYGTRNSYDELKTWAWTVDGVVKAVRHSEYRINGIMWHPERLRPFRHQDIERMRVHFKGE